MTDTQIQKFLDLCTVTNGTNEDGLDLTALFAGYVSWCLAGGTAPMANSMFVTAIRHHGVQHDDDQGTIRFYPGLRLVEPMSGGDVPGRRHAEAGVPGTLDPDILPA